ncbi:MAG: hypothetical protein CMP38_07130 [Rickettsiales bacterium]|nr:hypothetical protein [Rickettsiales bacterium]OUV98924.1 MAG: hypothetical protein CBD16_09220 [Betaproteobacteria bacterium TMED156]
MILDKTNTEFEVCLQGEILLSDISGWKYFLNQKYKKYLLNSVYFDTDNFTLLKNHLGLRLRYESTNWVQTLKLELPDHSRFEWNEHLDNNTSKFTPRLNPLFFPSEKDLISKNCHIGSSLRDLYCSLKPRFYVNVERVTWKINFHDGLIEVSIDHGLITNKAKKTTVSEIELELLEGPPYLLWLFAKRIITGFPQLRFEFRSKVFRGFLLFDFNSDNFFYEKKAYLSKKNNLKITTKEIILSKTKSFSFFAELILQNPDSHFLKIFNQTIFELNNFFKCLISSKKYSRKTLKNFYYFNNQFTYLINLISAINKIDAKSYITHNPKKTTEQQRSILLWRKTQLVKLKKILSNPRITKLIADLGLFANTMPDKLGNKELKSTILLKNIYKNIS